MIKIKFNLLQTLTMNSLNVKHQGKLLQPISISPVNLHAFMKTLKSNISEAYTVQGDCLKDSESDFYDKNDMKEKKTASYSEQIQILKLAPDKLSRMYCSEYFNVFEYLV